MMFLEIKIAIAINKKHSLCLASLELQGKNFMGNRGQGCSGPNVYETGCVHKGTYGMV